MSYAIGIDLGGTNIKYGLSDRLGNVLYDSIKPTYLPGKSVYDNILDIVGELKTHAASKGFTPEGIGIGVPAIIDEGLVTACTANLPELEGMPLGSRLAAQSGMPVFVANDANLMALGEWKFGAARNCTDAIFLTIGTGIGGAMLVNGNLYAGYRNRGAELGHIIVEADGRSCGCGGKGCLEAYASMRALIDDYKSFLGKQEKDRLEQEKDRLEQGKDRLEQGKDRLEHEKDRLEHEKDPLEKETVITGDLIISRYLENQPAAVQAMRRHFDYLAAGIAGLINIFSPQKLIIGGGISDTGDFYIQQIRERAMKRAMKETSLNTSVEVAQLGNKAGFLGAAALVGQPFF
ncbi:MAG TPA: ROK family protein [Puia sp.]|nr:ROK family protein [Puia sp.]